MPRVNTDEIVRDGIAYRVAHGGHGISDEDVERRYQESFEKLRQIIKNVTVLLCVITR